MRTREENLAIARYHAQKKFETKEKRGKRGPYNTSTMLAAIATNRNLTDYQLIAKAYGLTAYAVKRALERRKQYPNNRLVKAYDRLQAAKEVTLKKLVA